MYHNFSLFLVGFSLKMSFKKKNTPQVILADGLLTSSAWSSKPESAALPGGGGMLKTGWFNQGKWRFHKEKRRDHGDRMCMFTPKWLYYTNSSHFFNAEIMGMEWKPSVSGELNYWKLGYKDDIMQGAVPRWCLFVYEACWL